MRRSAELGFLNGHVPVTAIITAAAVVAAVLERRDAVVLSNEWSASVPTLVADGHAGEPPVVQGRGVRARLRRAGRTARSGPGLAVFSYLRPRTRAVGGASGSPRSPRYHGAFRSCNRAFHQDPAQRLDHWCGRCDKCCFIDLVLAPFMDRADLAAVFGGDEPLDDPANEGRFRALVGLDADTKPFECVGDIDECRAAVLPGGRQREDRAGTAPPAPAARRAGRRTPGRGAERRAAARAARARTTSLIAMHPPISWSALADASVGVWGLGVEGRASVRRLRAMGVDPVLVDDAPGAARPRRTRRPGHRRRVASRRCSRCDVVVKSPGISRYRPEVARLEAAGVAVCGGLGLFMEEADPTRVACITGTKGKSTTTALAVHLLTGLGYRARAGGNIGHPPWDPSPEPGARLLDHRDVELPGARPASRRPTWSR